MPELSLDHLGREISRFTGTPWALPTATLAELDSHLHRYQPWDIIEFGSGLSTHVIANYVASTGASALTLEHDRRFARSTLERIDPLSSMRLVVAPLTGKPPMYDVELPDRFDFALIDGPPSRTGGRAATFPSMAPLEHPGHAQVWLDDAGRSEEAQALGQWLQTHEGWDGNYNPALPHGLARLCPSPTALRADPFDFDAPDVTVTILTGHRPTLLADTWEHLPSWVRAGVARIVICHNGADRATADYIAETILPSLEAGGIDHYLIETHELIPGDEMLGEILKCVDTEFWLPLEDDWRHVTMEHSWLRTARQLLSDDPDLAQVRLRHTSETVLRKHMVTNTPIEWDNTSFGQESPDAHLTKNPSLMRTEQARELWPCPSERHMQRRAHSAGMHRVAQLHPGVFVHTGGDDSLMVRAGLRKR